MRGSGAVGSGTLKTQLLGLELWHIVNGVPWQGGSHLKHALQGSNLATPPTSCHPKCAPVTLAHLTSLRNGLNLSNTFDAAVFDMATVAFWCQCHLAKVCIDSSFDPLIHVSNISYSLFWALSMKTNPTGEEIRWTNSACLCSAEWEFKNHLEINNHVPLAAHIFAFETESGSFEPMCRQGFLERCNKVWSSVFLSPLSSHSFRMVALPTCSCWMLTLS